MARATLLRVVVLLWQVEEQGWKPCKGRCRGTLQPQQQQAPLPLSIPFDPPQLPGDFYTKLDKNFCVRGGQVFIRPPELPRE